MLSYLQFHCTFYEKPQLKSYFLLLDTTVGYYKFTFSSFTASSWNGSPLFQKWGFFYSYIYPLFILNCSVGLFLFQFLVIVLASNREVVVEWPNHKSLQCFAWASSFEVNLLSCIEFPVFFSSSWPSGSTILSDHSIYYSLFYHKSFRSFN